MLWDLVQQYQIRSAGASADSAAHQAGRAADETVRLRREVDRLSLACLAMWQMLQAHAGVTDEDLLRVMRELDASDGRVDGKLSVSSGDCPACGRPALKGRDSCMYCGAAIEKASPFHG